MCPGWCIKLKDIPGRKKRAQATLAKLHKKMRGKCGAKTRKGTPCQAPPVWDRRYDMPRNGRCKLHGGLSTGPKTEAGKEAIRLSNKDRKKIF